jgi:hypothetical protein
VGLVVSRLSPQEINNKTADKKYINFIGVNFFFNGHMDRVSSNEVKRQLNSSFIVTNFIMAYFLVRN